jgi:uncharacterized protein with von Willebrand factor type A (vWA) domain
VSSAASSPTLLRGVDRASFAISFVTRLRARGAATGVSAAGNLVRAMEVAVPNSRRQLYWTARVTVVHRQADLGVFDEVFDAVFGETTLGLDPHSRRPDNELGPSGAEYASVPNQVGVGAYAGGPPGGSRPPAGALPWVTLPPAVADAEDSESPVSFPLRLPSELMAVADTAFELLTPDQLGQLGRWLESSLPSWPTRRSRRNQIQSRGRRVALRPTMARARRTGWEPVVLVKTRAINRPRRIVLLCDVSQSMQAQAAAYLHLMRAFAMRTDAEVFAFSTGLTRLTSVLRHHSAEIALEQATARVDDRFGGTRIATSIRTLLASRHGGVVRGAIVLIGSDGWDSDPPQALATEMARLRRRAYRLVWMNPRAGAPDFAPTVSTMAAALPYCDQMLPADTFASLAGVLRALSSRGSHG